MAFLNKIKKRQLFFIGIVFSFFATLFFGAKIANDIKPNDIPKAYADVPTPPPPPPTSSGHTYNAADDDDSGN